MEALKASLGAKGKGAAAPAAAAATSDAGEEAPGADRKPARRSADKAEAPAGPKKKAAKR